MAVEHLIGHGFRKITCVVINSHLRPVRERIAGHEETLRHARLPATKTLVLPDEEAAEAVLAKLFNSPDRPDALFTTNNACTISVIRTLKRLGIEVPRDVALIGFDDVDFYTLLSPPVTTIRQPAAELGSISTRLLLQRIRQEASSSSIRTVLPVTLVIRESCGCGEETLTCSNPSRL